MTFKKVNIWTFNFGAIFKINAHTAILRRFSRILPKFLQILLGFSPNQKFWGCACNPCNPPPTPVW